MKFNFPIIIIDEDFRSENASGHGIRDLADAIEKEGIEVVGMTSYGDMTSFAQQQSRASAFVLSIDDEEFGAGSEEETEVALRTLRAFVEEIRFKNADIPIFLCGETRTSRHLPNDILRELHGFIHMHEDTPEFVARYILREARADAVRAGRFVFLALPRPFRRGGVPEEPGRADVPPVLRREPAARGPVQRGRRARPAARSHRARSRG